MTLSRESTPRHGRASTGALGEDFAVKFLERKGYTIITRNYRRKWGEIDIIASKKSIVYFVEVKAVQADLLSRESGQYRPEENIHPEKLRKIVRTATIYMSETRDTREYQIDAVAVILDPITRQARCRHYEQII